jgi:hypothetical protein
MKKNVRTVYLWLSIPNAATGQKVCCYGDLSHLIRREVRNSLTVRTYVERCAEQRQIAYESFWRMDGALAKSAVSPVPVKYLQMA